MNSTFTLKSKREVGLHKERKSMMMFRKMQVLLKDPIVKNILSMIALSRQLIRWRSQAVLRKIKNKLIGTLETKLKRDLILINQKMKMKKIKIVNKI
jgi:hypothetical protein